MAKKNKIKDAFLEQLRKIPIIQVACEKVGVSRNSVYRWRKEDKEFEKSADEAMIEGESLISDMSEHQVISLIRDRNFPAIQLWLKHHHPKYNNKVEISGTFAVQDETLTPEESAEVLRALKLAGVSEDNEPELKHGSD